MSHEDFIKLVKQLRIEQRTFFSIKTTMQNQSVDPYVRKAVLGNCKRLEKEVDKAIEDFEKKQTELSL